MSTATMTNRLELSSVAETTLKAAARFWFAVTVFGQVVFGFTVASFYALTALRGDYHKWNFTNGYVPGFSMGNTAVVMHVASAAFVMLAGAVQLVPQVRNRFPVFHRWNGRIYMLTAVTLSMAGLYMTWIRGSVGDLSVHLGSTLNAVLIWLCGGMALRYALARDFKTHRRWALRFFLVVSASWFFRIGFFLSLLIFKGPFGFDPTTFRGPFLDFYDFRPIPGSPCRSRNLPAGAGSSRRTAARGHGRHAFCTDPGDGRRTFCGRHGAMGASAQSRL